MAGILAFSSLHPSLSSETWRPSSEFTADFWGSMQFKQPRSTAEELLSSDLFQQIKARYEEYTDQLSGTLPIDYSIPPDTGEIPAIIHFIWLGSELPSEAEASINSWKSHHPGWEVKVWTDADLNNFPWTSDRIKKCFESAENYAEKADILRLEVLYQFGGIYSDIDVVCLKPFHDLIRLDLHFFAGIEVNYVSSVTKNPLHIGTAILGSARGGQTVKYCLDNILGFAEHRNVHILNRTGPGLCSRSAVNSIENDSEKIVLLPSSYFYPFPFEKRHLLYEKAIIHRSDETMAIHLMRGSWLSQEELDRVIRDAIRAGYVTQEEEL